MFSNNCYCCRRVVISAQCDMIIITIDDEFKQTITQPVAIISQYITLQYYKTKARSLL